MNIWLIYKACTDFLILLESKSFFRRLLSRNDWAILGSNRGYFSHVCDGNRLGIVPSNLGRIRGKFPSGTGLYTGHSDLTLVIVPLTILRELLHICLTVITDLGRVDFARINTVITTNRNVGLATIRAIEKSGRHNHLKMRSLAAEDRHLFGVGFVHFHEQFGHITLSVKICNVLFKLVQRGNVLRTGQHHEYTDSVQGLCFVEKIIQQINF